MRRLVLSPASWMINLVGMAQRRRWHPTPVLLPGKSHGWRSLVGCSPWGREESDTTEQLHVHFSLSCTGEGNGNPLQYSCLKDPRDGGAWWPATYGVTQSLTWLKWLSSSCQGQFILRLLPWNLGVSGSLWQSRSITLHSALRFTWRSCMLVSVLKFPFFIRTPVLVDQTSDLILTSYICTDSYFQIRSHAKGLGLRSCSVTKSCLTLCSPMDCPSLSPGVCSNSLHWVDDAIQPSHSLLLLLPPAFNLSWHQGLFQWVGSLHLVASASASSLPMNFSGVYVK